MALYNVLYDLDSAVGNSGKKLVGVTADVQNTTMPESTVAGGSAIDQITVASTITPDIVNMQWVHDLYNPIAGMAISLFGTLLLFAVCAYLYSLIAEDYHIGSEMMSIVKRSFIEIPAIYFGLDIIAGCLNANMMLSTMFGGSVNVSKLLSAGFMDPSGLLIFAYAIGTALTAWFYICRYYIVIVCIMLWAIGCILRIFNVTRPTGMLILRIALINIFLGTWMCVCYAAGAWVTGSGTNILTSWGTSIIGLIIMYFALSVPRKLWNSQISNGLERTGKKAVTYVKMVV